MEGEKQWRPLNDVSIPVFGASSSSLNESVYLIGGLTAGNKNPQTVLQVRNFDMMNWSPVAVNANKTLNRAYHASATLDGSVYIFGGAVASNLDGNEILLSEVVKCTPDSLEGLKCVAFHSPSAELKGLSASTMGAGDLLQKMIVFGGSSAEGTCDSSDLLVYVGDDEEQMITNDDVLKTVVAANGPAPSPRSHHASAVAGHRQEYLIVAGGWNGSEAYDDLWLCDTTNLLSGRALEPEEVNPVKGKKKDEVPIPDLYTWHQICLAEPIDGRFMHGCWATCPGTLDDGLRIGIFGGMSACGPIGHESMLQYVVEFDGQECNAQLEFAPETGREDIGGEDTRYGFTTETIYENGLPTLIFVFGGKHMACDSHCCVLDPSSDIAAHVAACVPLPDEDKNGEEESNIKVITYPNGDVYEGEIFVDVEEDAMVEVEDTAQIRHGQGVMKYADGAVYEVRCMKTLA